MMAFGVVFCYSIIQLNSIIFSPVALAGLGVFTSLDQVGMWSIERKVQPKTYKIFCRASIKTSGSWYSTRIRLDDNDQIYFPTNQTFESQKIDMNALKKVKLALDQCRSDLIYSFE